MSDAKPIKPPPTQALGRDWCEDPPRDPSELLQAFEDWLDVTGAIPKSSGWYRELRSFFEEDVPRIAAALNATQVKAEEPPVRDGVERCSVCSWPLFGSIEEGCTPESCSMRPRPKEKAEAPAEWTREPPTEPGWYWYRTAEDIRPRAVEVFGIHGVLRIRWKHGNVDSLAEAPMSSEWQGPIKPRE